jgi:hypothetical protein
MSFASDRLLFWSVFQHPLLNQRCDRSISVSRTDYLACDARYPRRFNTDQIPNDFIEYVLEVRPSGRHAADQRVNRIIRRGNFSGGFTGFRRSIISEHQPQRGKTRRGRRGRKTDFRRIMRHSCTQRDHSGQVTYKSLPCQIAHAALVCSVVRDEPSDMA